MINVLYEQTKNHKKTGPKIENDKHELKPIDEGGFSYWSKITHRWVKGHYSKSKAQFLPPEKGRILKKKIFNFCNFEGPLQKKYPQFFF